MSAPSARASAVDATSGASGASGTRVSASPSLLTSRVVRRGSRSVVLHPRLVLVTTGLLLAAVVLGLYSLTVGSLSLSMPDVVAALFGQSDSARDTRVVRMVRAPRVLCGLAAGAALGASGAVFQSVSRNALGSPDVIGFTTGAASGALVQIIVYDAAPLHVAGGAVVGGLLTAALVHGLSRRDGTTGGHRLILTGIGVGATLSALNGLLLVKGSLESSVQANLWLAGSLDARTWAHAIPVVVGATLLVPLTASLSRRLSLVEMGDEVAAQLGVPVDRVRLAAMLLAVLLAALATAAVGPIAFVALAAPQLAVRLTRTPGVPMLGAAATGAFLLVAADVVTQLLPVDMVIPIGRMTGILGGLYLLWLLGRGARR